MYDFLIVGSGLFGSVFAYEANKIGKKCLIIEKRSHIGGNCYSEKVDNIDIHKYGPHIFHTNDKKIWKYINSFSDFNIFLYRPKAKFNDKIYSFPINLMTLHQMWGVNTPEEAENILERKRIKIDNPKNLEEWAISQVGKEIYEKFIYGYTKKQWNRDPKALPASIIKRLPIRLYYDDNYFTDKYQGIPTNGYTAIFEKMLEGIEIQLGVDFLKNKEKYESICKKIVYTGPIDEFFNYKYGPLEWRSLKFKEKIYDFDFQGNCVINHTSEDVNYTRTIEHKFFNYKNQKKSIVTFEYPQDWSIDKEKYYPVPDKKNKNLYFKYKKLIDEEKYIFGGRLADYQYYDMHQVIARSLKKFKMEVGNE